MSVFHQISAVDQRVLETRPDLPAQLRRDVQLHAQIPQTDTGQVINLKTDVEDELIKKGKKTKHPTAGKTGCTQQRGVEIQDTEEDEQL